MKRAPIVGMPANRPHCPWCHRQLAIWCEWQNEAQRGQPRKWRSWPVVVVAVLDGHVKEAHR